jgi:hypothetical protein
VENIFKKAVQAGSRFANGSGASLAACTIFENIRNGTDFIFRLNLAVFL